MSFGKFAVRVLIGFCVLVLSKALLTVANYCGWHPEQHVANLLLASPTILQVTWVTWALVASVAVLFWLLFDFVFYGRPYADSIRWLVNAALIPVEALQARIDRSRARFGPQYKAPGIVWLKRRGTWRAVWRATPEAVKLGFKPQSVTIWVGNEKLTRNDKLWIRTRAKDLRGDMDAAVVKLKTEPSLDDVLASIRKIIAVEKPAS